MQDNLDPTIDPNTPPPSTLGGQNQPAQPDRAAMLQNLQPVKFLNTAQAGSQATPPASQPPATAQPTQPVQPPVLPRPPQPPTYQQPAPHAQPHLQPQTPANQAFTYVPPSAPHAVQHNPQIANAQAPRPLSQPAAPTHHPATQPSEPEDMFDRVPETQTLVAERPISRNDFNPPFQPTKPPAPPEPAKDLPQPTKPANPPKKRSFPILPVMFLVLAAAIGGWYLWRQTQPTQEPITYVEPTPTLEPEATFEPMTTASPSATASASATPRPTASPSSSPITAATGQTYTSAQGMSVSYPAGWSVKTQTVKRGDTLRVPGHNDVVARGSDVEVVDISKGAWTVELVISYVYNTLGGYGPVDNFNGHQEIPIFNRTALRPRVEDGTLPFVGSDTSEPYAMSIIFRRFPTETDSSWRTPDRPGNYVGLFSTNDPSNQKFNLNITVYSPNLTKATIQGKTISAQDMAEVDQILSSIKLTP